MFKFKNTIEINGLKDLIPIRDYLLNFKMKNESTNIHESLSMAIYLISLSKISNINYSVKLIKRESPDFLLLNSEKEIGIEHSISTVEQYKIALKELDKMPEGSNLELPFYSPFKKIKNKDSSIGIRKPDENLNGLGWAGDSAEREWVEIISNSIFKKTKLLNTPSFQKFKYNELILEDQSPVDFILEIGDAVSHLKERQNDKVDRLIIFDKIHIFTCNTFIYDVLNTSQIIDVSKKSL